MDVGYLLYELVHGFSPFRPKRQNFEDEELIENIKNHNLLFYMPTSDEFEEVVFRLLETDVNKRYNFDDICNSKFVKKYEMEEYEINYNINNKVNDEENTKYEIKLIGRFFMRITQYLKVIIQKQVLKMKSKIINSQLKKIY